MQSTSVLTDMDTSRAIGLRPFRKSICFKLKEMLKRVPSCYRISQTHSFCHMLDKNLATLLHLFDPQALQSAQQV